ncbi:MAG TPA: mycofactocin biosynthesis glycosyltransferase MftF [Ktedonobacteraceae bacterium]|nr:mycofactocin biosynthesis glycosyltransferase MftF [Ktedonobacteraceae bacterium]
MNASYRQPQRGHYRLARGVRIMASANAEDAPVALCAYPLRALRLSTTAARLLSLCAGERSAEQLAREMHMSVSRVSALCAQLHWKGLLEAGPLLPLQDWPGVSIVIPTHNRAQQLERCLRSLLSLDYPAPCLEIIVVDDGSSDETPALLQCMQQEAAQQDISLRTLRHHGQKGVAVARNTGAAAAQHDLIAYIDSDCVASARWLAELVPAFQDAHLGAAGGMIRAYDLRPLLGRYEDVRSSLFMGVRPQQVLPDGPLNYLPTANLLVRRSKWQQIGGFAPLTFGEDVDFCRRLLSAGAAIIYLPQGVVYHDYRTGPGAFLRVRASYASAEAVLLQLHPTGRRILVLPPEQALFAASTIGAAWNMLPSSRRPFKWQKKEITTKMGTGSTSTRMFAFACVLTLLGSWMRLRKARAQRIPAGPLAVFKATLRSHLAYTYHLCRHLTRYYTLPLLLGSLLCPPLFLLLCICCGIVTIIDYVRLRPEMNFGAYALCSLLDDCAYEAGVVWGCIKCRTWKPLVPIIRRRL